MHGAVKGCTGEGMSVFKYHASRFFSTFNYNFFDSRVASIITINEITTIINVILIILRIIYLVLYKLFD